MDDIYADFWGAFLEETGTPENTVLQNYTYFGDSEEASVAAMEQFLSGERTAISHCVPAYLTTRQRMPQVGDYTMVMDYYGNPCVILHTTDITIAPMPEISEELCRQDNPELDREGWLNKKHEEYADLAKRMGFHYHDEIPVLVETVERVYPMKS